MKRLLLICTALMLSVLGVSAFAAGSKQTLNVPFVGDVHLGDVITLNYNLNQSHPEVYCKMTSHDAMIVMDTTKPYFGISESRTLNIGNPVGFVTIDTLNKAKDQHNLWPIQAEGALVLNGRGLGIDEQHPASVSCTYSAS